MTNLHRLIVLLLVMTAPVCAAPPGLIDNAASSLIESAPINAPPIEAAEVRVLLAPELETTRASAMAGQIAAVNVGLGDAFAAGKTLLRFDCDEQQARLEMANAELSSARELLESKRRLLELKQAGKVEVAIAGSAVDKAQAQIKLLRVQLDYCSVKAPFAGRVVRLAVKAHQGVTAAQPLLEIVSAGALKLRLNVPARWVNWLQVGTAFHVTIDETGKTYQAKVSARNARIDAVSQTIEIEAVMVDHAPELLPGMSGTAHFTPPT
ncbi:efflux RND transporter periplasmic adaptor subunit [Chromatium okenii]|uniref:efflux RND transporter periplasmic adaptor subunit n=1 Tax=Chromatium okenii TaxID=61644 RepID=UPI0026EBA669|nr:efflux RND transporter periplasmic adaptor subunit [Chromatium okenii]MBV5310663.1 efflux RND transporter periplasmic adaptor subunit [Chromatium okenii]